MGHCRHRAVGRGDGIAGDRCATRCRCRLAQGRDEAGSRAAARLRDAWIEALGKVRTTRNGAAALAQDAALFDPDRVIQGAALTPGSYRCRMYRLGGVGAGARVLLSGGWAGCRVTENGLVRRFVTDGAQRASGNLFDSTDSRTVFLGTLALGDEDRPMRYGRDARRDMAGLVERIGPDRWLMVLPFPGFQSTLDVMEIVRG